MPSSVSPSLISVFANQDLTITYKLNPSHFPPTYMQYVAKEGFHLASSNGNEEERHGRSFPPFSCFEGLLAAMKISGRPLFMCTSKALSTHGFEVLCHSQWALNPSKHRKGGRGWEDKPLAEDGQITRARLPGKSRTLTFGGQCSSAHYAPPSPA